MALMTTKAEVRFGCPRPGCDGLIEVPALLSLGKEVDELRAENERLKAALDHLDTCKHMPWRQTPDCCRQALSNGLIDPPGQKV